MTKILPRRRKILNTQPIKLHVHIMYKDIYYQLNPPHRKRSMYQCIFQKCLWFIHIFSYVLRKSHITSFQNGIWFAKYS